MPGTLRTLCEGEGWLGRSGIRLQDVCGSRADVVLVETGVCSGLRARQMCHEKSDTPPVRPLHYGSSIKPVHAKATAKDTIVVRTQPSWLLHLANPHQRARATGRESSALSLLIHYTAHVQTILLAAISITCDGNLEPAVPVVA